MLSRLLDPTGTPRDRVFWLVLAAVIASQLLALVVLCTHQVRDAEARRSSWQVGQGEVVDCRPGEAAGVPVDGCAPSVWAIR